VPQECILCGQISEIYMDLHRNPLISVVVPTRERCDTLAATLRTCTDQDYENCEILVSDNFSQDDTRAVVASVRDSRVRYANTGKRLSMSHNWEFALSQARGDFVTFVGDDDALLPGALTALVRLIRDTQTSAVTWRWASYFWPNCLHKPSNNLLFVPIDNHVEHRSAPKVLREVLEFRTGYEQLPFFYKGIVSTALINQVRTASGGRFFHSMIPDVYSAIALSFFVTDYVYSHKPYSMNGTSEHSNGAAQLDQNLRPAQAFLSEANIPFHEHLVLAPSTSVFVAEAFLQARDSIKPNGNWALDIKKMFVAAMRESAAAPPERYGLVRDAVLATGKKHGLNQQARDAIAAHPNQPPINLVGLTKGFNVVRRAHVIDCSKLGAHNIHQAANVCAAILGAPNIGLVQSPFAVARTTATIIRGLLRRTIHKWVGIDDVRRKVRRMMSR
jgi:glycosyltransferase involved in cell wall biosynthesis